MSTSRPTYKIFISCTSQIVEELEYLYQVENIINTVRSDFKIQFLHYTRNTYPTSGNHPQKIILDQIDNDYNVYLGIFWTKYGSKTGNYDSGVIEEFEKAVKAGKRIMFYFNEMSPPYLDDINLEDCKKIREFRHTLQNRGIFYWTYKGIRDFENTVLQHITNQIEEIHISTSGQIPIFELEEDFESEYYEMQYDELSDFDEFIESLESALNELRNMLKDNLEDLTTFLQILEHKIEPAVELERSLRKKKAVAIYKKIADSISQFKLKLETNLRLLQENSDNVTKHMNDAVLFFPKRNLEMEEARELLILHQPIGEMVEFYKTTSEEITKAKVNLTLSSKFSHHIKKQNRDLIKILDDLQGQIDIYSKNIEDFEMNYIVKLGIQ